MSEKNDGYQYFFIYNQFSSSSSCIQEVEMNYGGAGITTTYGYQSYLLTYNLSSFASTDKMCILFGASGKNEDTWYIKDRVFTIKSY